MHDAFHHDENWLTVVSAFKQFLEAPGSSRRSPQHYAISARASRVCRNFESAL